jgi:hypothetical protein
MKKYIVLIVVTVLSSLQLDAQSPQGFNYHQANLFVCDCF